MTPTDQAGRSAWFQAGNLGGNDRWRLGLYLIQKLPAPG
jgi:hypothetical protein